MCVGGHRSCLELLKVAMVNLSKDRHCEDKNEEHDANDWVSIVDLFTWSAKTHDYPNDCKLTRCNWFAR